jgi:hypothetical protein
MIGKLADLLRAKDYHVQRCAMYAKFVRDLTYHEFISAFYSVGKKFRFMPEPKEFIELVRKGVSQDDEARLITGKIIESVNKYGYYNFKDAQGYIGEIGIKALDLYGGWHSLCESLTIDNKGVIFAQLLGMVKSVLSVGVDYFKKQNLLEHNELEQVFHG